MIKLSEFVKKVQDDFEINKCCIKKDIQSMLPSIKILQVELWGRYGKHKTHEPTEDSDVDLLIVYKGNMKEDEVSDALLGQLAGYGGIYDIFIHKTSKKMTNVELKDLSIENAKTCRF